MAEPNEPPHSAEPPEDFLLRHLQLLERIAASFAHRKNLPGPDAEDFSSWVKEKLLEDDYRRIRAYRGQCKPAHFLSVTVGNLGKDFLDKKWQRWRPSAEALRLGPVGVLLDQLLNRDGRTFDEACEELRTRHGVTTPKAELERYAATIHRRPRRRLVSEENLLNAPAREATPEKAALDHERDGAKGRAVQALRIASSGLPPGDRILLRLHFGDGLSIADIARVQKTDQKSLYRRRDKILRFLREELHRSGLGKAEIDPLF